MGSDAAGIEQLTAQLLSLQPALVVVEAMGGYEFEAACALQAAGLALVNPCTARDFVRAMGILTKTGRWTRACLRVSPACGISANTER